MSSDLLDFNKLIASSNTKAGSLMRLLQNALGGNSTFEADVQDGAIPQGGNGLGVAEVLNAAPLHEDAGHATVITFAGHTLTLPPSSANRSFDIEIANDSVTVTETTTTARGVTTDIYIGDSAGFALSKEVKQTAASTETYTYAGGVLYSYDEVIAHPTDALPGGGTETFNTSGPWSTAITETITGPGGEVDTKTLPVDVTTTLSFGGTTGPFLSPDPVVFVMHMVDSYVSGDEAIVKTYTTDYPGSSDRDFVLENVMKIHIPLIGSGPALDVDGTVHGDFTFIRSSPADDCQINLLFPATDWTPTGHGQNIAYGFSDLGGGGTTGDFVQEEILSTVTSGGKTSNSVEYELFYSPCTAPDLSSGGEATNPDYVLVAHSSSAFSDSSVVNIGAELTEINKLILEGFGGLRTSPVTLLSY